MAWSMRFIAGLVLLMFATACSSQTTGQVQGQVPLCEGRFGNASLPTTVLVIKHGQTIATQQVRAGDLTRDLYRFTLPPGEYTIVAPSEHNPVTVTLRRGQLLTADLKSTCK